MRSFPPLPSPAGEMSLSVVVQSSVRARMAAAAGVGLVVGLATPQQILVTAPVSLSMAMFKNQPKTGIASVKEMMPYGINIVGVYIVAGNSSDAGEMLKELKHCQLRCIVIKMNESSIEVSEEGAPCSWRYQAVDSLLGAACAVFRIRRTFVIEYFGKSDLANSRDNMINRLKELKRIIIHSAITDIIASSNDDRLCADILSSSDSAKRKKAAPSTTKAVVSDGMAVDITCLDILQPLADPQLSPLSLTLSPSSASLCRRNLTVDAVAYVPRDATLGCLFDILLSEIRDQITRLCLLLDGEENEIIAPTTYQYLIPEVPHYITLSYAVHQASPSKDDHLMAVRRNLHQRLGLPMDRPIIRICNAIDFRPIAGGLPRAAGGYFGRLKNVHEGLPPSGVQGGVVSLCHGVYYYYHYLQDSFDDKGWGCAYRSGQTIMSWFIAQNYVDTDVPSIRQIQEALVKMGDKDKKFIGSREWIGAIELSMCLDHFLDVTCKIMPLSSGAELADKGRDLAQHFETQGTPIMSGGGNLAYTILGVDFNASSGDIKFLILDPHYTGHDVLSSIQPKWCGWKDVDLFDKLSFYNLCMPQRPNKL